MVERIDAFGHVMPEGLHAELEQIRPTRSYGGLPDGMADYFKAQGFIGEDLRTRIDDLDEFEVDKQVITQQPPEVWEGIDPDAALPLTRLANDEVRRIADEHSERLIPVGTLPYLGKPYLDEFERCIDELGMAGVQIFSNCGGKPLDREEFTPFFELVERKGVPIWLHPQNNGWSDWLEEFAMNFMLGWPFDTSVALARLVLGGVMDRFDLDIITHHMGGMIAHFSNRIPVFYLANSMDETFSANRAAEIRDGLRKFYPDTARQGSPRVLEEGHDFFGRDHLLFGTDYPFGPERGRWFVREEIKAVEEMDISSSEREMVYSGNFKQILGDYL